MKSHLYPLLFLCAFAGTLTAQTSVTRHRLELDSAGVFPVGGYKADEYSAGPALRAGYELRLRQYLAVDLGWTSAWLPGTSCSRFGCDYPRYQNRLLDYGLRGVLPLAQDRVELSVGLGGGYIWFNKTSGDSGYYNGSLLQYSAKATVALDRSKHIRMGFSVRTWRDLGRPIQQWLSTAVGISYGFGSAW
jgi:hypothetical protein